MPAPGAYARCLDATLAVGPPLQTFPARGQERSGSPAPGGLVVGAGGVDRVGQGDRNPIAALVATAGDNRVTIII